MSACRDGFDKFGYDREGFDKRGFDKYGYNKAGVDKEGYDVSGFDKNGYNKWVPNVGQLVCACCWLGRMPFCRQLLRLKQGMQAPCRAAADACCAALPLPSTCRDGFDKNGFNKYGYDKNGFDKDGFDK